MQRLPIPHRFQGISGSVRQHHHPEDTFSNNLPWSVIQVYKSGLCFEGLNLHVDLPFWFHHNWCNKPHRLMMVFELKLLEKFHNQNLHIKLCKPSSDAHTRSTALHFKVNIFSLFPSSVVDKSMIFKTITRWLKQKQNRPRNILTSSYALKWQMISLASD